MIKKQKICGMTLEKAVGGGNYSVYRYGVFDEVRFHRIGEPYVIVPADVEGRLMFRQSIITEEETALDDWRTFPKSSLWSRIHDGLWYVAYKLGFIKEP